MNQKKLVFSVLSLCFIIPSSHALLHDAYLTAYGNNYNLLTSHGRIMLFHTGTSDAAVLYDRESWTSVLAHIGYIKFDGGFAHFNEDGSVTPLLGHGSHREYARIFNVTVEGFRQSFLDVRKVIPGAIPVFQLGVIDNVDFVNYTQLKTYLSGLSKWLEDYKAHGFLTLCGEFNFPEGMDGWGHVKNIHGEWINSKVEPSSYIRLLQLARKVIDDENISNVLLSSHVNLLRNIYINGTWIEQDWLTEFRGIEEYYEGISQADILGFSFYFNYDELDMAWERVRLVRDAVGGEKPVLFIEYGNRVWWDPHPIVTAEFVDLSYNKREQYKFVKGILWHLWPEYCDNDAFAAIAANAEIWEGK